MNINLSQLRASRLILGVNCAASKTDIKRAFKAKALTLHPDLWHTQKVNKTHIYHKWARLVNAYQLLRNYDSPAQRAKYNQGHRHHTGSAKVSMVLYAKPDPRTHQ